MNRIAALAVLTAGLLSPVSANPAPRLIGDTPTIRSIALGVGPGGGCELLAMLMEEEGLQGETFHSLVLRTIHQRTGMREGADLRIPFPTGILPTALIVSSFFRPGSVLVLDIDANIHIFPIGYDQDESPVLIDNPDLFPIGNANSFGPALSLAETPESIAVGTFTGEMVLGAKAPGPPQIRRVLLEEGPILSLTAVPAPNGAALLALVGVGPGGGCIFGVDPGTGTILFEAEVPGPSMLTSISYPVSDLLARMGSRLESLDVVFSTSTGGVGDLVIVDGDDQVIRMYRNDGRVQFAPGNSQIVTGSLAVLEGDGSGVLYDPAFSLENGLGGVLLTVAGATMDLSPRTLNRKSRGRFVTAVIEVENMLAVDILPETVTLAIGDTRIPTAPRAPALGDEDLDGNPDLLVHFSRDEVLTAFEHGDPNSPVVVGALWTNRDGSRGRASAVLRAVR